MDIFSSGSLVFINLVTASESTIQLTTVSLDFTQRFSLNLSLIQCALRIEICMRQSELIVCTILNRCLSCILMQVFKECQATDDSGNSFELSLVGCKCIGAYVRNKKNQNQICWIWQKVSSDNDRRFQRFLDTVQCKCNSILRYERTFGQGFVSTGGFETMKEFMGKLDIKPGQKVLMLVVALVEVTFIWQRNLMSILWA